MEIAKTVDLKHLIESSSHWQSASDALVAGDIKSINIPIPDINALPKITQHIQNINDEHLQNLHNSNIEINLHFNSHPETQDALSLLQRVLPPSALNPSISKGVLVPTNCTGTVGGIPSLTIAQGAEGGALIGGVGGAGVALLVQGIKSTADALGNPILVTLGAVLSGIAVGAVGGAAFAKFNQITVGVTKTGASLSGSV